MRLKNPRIGIFPHLTIGRGNGPEPTPRRREGPDQLVRDYIGSEEKFEALVRRSGSWPRPNSFGSIAASR